MQLVFHDYVIVLRVTSKLIVTYIKARNIFIFPKIIFNSSLILSSYIILLGLIFTNNIFLASSLILVIRISELDISLSYK
jgi:hypothetical protein